MCVYLTPDLQRPSFSVIPPDPEEDIYAYTQQLSQQFDPGQYVCVCDKFPWPGTSFASGSKNMSNRIPHNE